MKRYAIKWRMGLDATLNAAEFEQMLDLLNAEESVADEFWIFISEPTSYCYEPLESIAEKCEKFKKALDKCVKLWYNIICS